MHTDRASFLGLKFDRVTFEELLTALGLRTSTAPYRYLVTPNVDHVVSIDRHPELRPIWNTADVSVCDSRILRLLAAIRRIKLPVVPGSDLTAALFNRVVNAGDTIAIVGGGDETLRRLIAKYPQIRFVHHNAPRGLRTDAAARTRAAEFVALSNARFSFIAVGSPQQEMIAAQARRIPDAAGTALCVGAGLEFVTGEQRRAPRIIQRLSLEWAHRLLTNPRRLWRRYLVDDLRILPIFFRSHRWGWSLGIFGLLLLVAVAGAGVFLAAPTRDHSDPSVEIPLSPSKVALPDLPPPDLLRDVTPEEAAAANEQRPFSERADGPARPLVLKVDAETAARAELCLSQAVYYEAASEGDEGQRAVAQVVLNRARHPGYPNSICGVVYQGSERSTGCQFSFTCDGSLDRRPAPAVWRRATEIARKALAGYVSRGVGHATHYHADYVLPYWADSLDKSAKIGRHIFYRLKGNLGSARAFSQAHAGNEPQPVRPTQTTVISPSEMTPQLEEALLGLNIPDSAVVTAEKATPQAAGTLLADSAAGVLLADPAPPTVARNQKEAEPCADGDDSKQLSAIKREDMRASKNRC